MSEDPGRRPNQQYYRAAEGHWECAFDFAIVDWKAFRASPMRFMDRLRALTMALGRKLLGPLLLETSVAFPTEEGGDVVHTTRLSKWGMTMMSGVEHLTLHEDGQSARMRAEHRLWPTSWATRTFEGEVRVAADAKHALYTFPWFGSTMQQTGEAIDGGTTLTQRTEWSLGVQRLRRVTPTRVR